MQPKGFEETQSAFASDDPRRLVGEWRKFGSYGPRYEVLAIESNTDARIRVHTSGEITAYPIADILRDPED